MQLTHLHLENFKCFEHTDIEFAPITLLTGANSSGKTAIIHAILGALQSGEFPFNFSPNGDYVNMGNYKRMVKDGDVTKNIKLNLEIGPIYYETEWGFDKETNMPIMILCKINTGQKESWDITINNSNQDMNIMVYTENNESTISSIYYEEKSRKLEGDGVKSEYIMENGKLKTFTIYDLEPSWWTNKKYLYSFTDISIRWQKALNELCFSSLAYLSSHRLPPQDYYYETTKSNLKVKADGGGFADQILQWQTQRDPRYKALVKIVKDLALAKDLKAKRNSNGTYELQIKPNNGGSPLSNLTDVGFGISQLLPIIVADLQLGNESLLIISQPETHLHPSIQAAFADYLTHQIRETQKRYIVETHSEYMINRLHLAIAETRLAEDHLAVYYLQNNGQKANTFRIGFHKNGRITNAPEDFFETYMLDTTAITLAAE